MKKYALKLMFGDDFTEQESKVLGSIAIVLLLPFMVINIPAFLLVKFSSYLLPGKKEDDEELLFPLWGGTTLFSLAVWLIIFILYSFIGLFLMIFFGYHLNVISVIVGCITLIVSAIILYYRKSIFQNEYYDEE